MTVKRIIFSVVFCSMLSLTIASMSYAQQAPAPAGQKDWRLAAGPVKIYNTAKQKIMEGKQIVGGTVSSPDPNIYCAMANAGFDFLWIEMQHSPLTYSDVAKMIWACKGPAVPFIRVPDATESEIQKATDIGALGIIVPTVDTVEKAEAAVRWAKYPPVGRRSMGAGQYRELWGTDYRQTINDNMMVVIMIETPIGAAVADKIAAVPGVDVVFAASTDLGNFSGYRQGDAPYEALVTRIHDATLKADRKLGGPQAWQNRPGYSFLQGAGEATLIKMAGSQSMGTAPAAGAKRAGQ
jgi:2-keto-3-deoxy-L-rhamnonate aldolase RhmA